MKTIIYNTLTILLMLFIGIKTIHSQTIVSFESLLKEMTDREVLSEYPSPYYTNKQFSSYDRATVTPDDKSWFANWDRNMFVRDEVNQGRKEYVLMDVKGPGAIVRVWMTFAGKDSGKGILRIYLDNNPNPVIEGDAISIISGGQLAGAPISTSVSELTDPSMRGHNLYLPIPYSENCKITYESENIVSMGAKTAGEEAVYYNIKYRTYEEDADVNTFELTQLDTARGLIEETQKKLIDKDFTLPEETKLESFGGSISKGENLKLTIDQNSSAIRKMTIKLSADDHQQALRSTIIHASFDGNKTISTPIGDFFGTGYKIIPNESWYSKIKADGTMSCSWVMPFKSKSEIIIENIGHQTVNIDIAEVHTSPYEWTSNTMYFGSTWKQFSFLRTGEMKNNEGDGSPFDINYVNIKGKGVYVGDCLTLFNTVYAWWGEGDEKIYVDGESFPSHIGTGTEDYYGYAWCRPEKIIGHPFISQPDGSGNFDPGYTSNIRYRSLDIIPFSKSLRFDMEMWHWTKAIIHFSPVTFWYISPKDAKKLPQSKLIDATFPVAKTREDIIAPVITDNKIEAENMKFEKATGGTFRYSNNVNRGWSNNMQVHWSNMNPDDELTLSFLSNEDMDSDIILKYSKGPHYSTFTFTINEGEPVTINSFDETDSVAQYKLENVKINNGVNSLSIKYLQSEERKQIGIDCIEFIE